MKKIEIKAPYEKFNCKRDDNKAVLTAFENETGVEKAPAMIVCPGGAYFFLCDREGTPVAQDYASNGIKAFMLEYSVTPNVFPSAQMELALAIKHIRENCDEYGVDPDKIYICGFSAGGHLCASMGTLYNKGLLEKALDTTKEMIKPNGMVLSYPVITSGEFAHEGSFINLLGTDNIEESEFYKYVSLEKQVDEETAPTFIWTTVKDTLVPMENSMLFVQALRNAGVEVEFHMFPIGDHGLSTGRENAMAEDHDKDICDYIHKWFDMSVAFIKKK